MSFNEKNMKRLYKIKKVWIFLWFLLIVGATFGVIVFNYGLDYLKAFAFDLPKFERETPEPVELDYVTVPAGHFSINKYNFYVDSFDIYKTEVTIKDYYALTGKNPTKENNQSVKPVNMVTWNNCIEYCNAKSVADGLEPVYTIENKVVTADFTKNGWRLPTKTEWYWAAAGAKEPKEYDYSGSDDIENVAWYLKNSGSATHEVGSKNSNQLGIFDMTGNVSEWCWDKWWDWAAEPKSTEEVANYKGSESEKVIKRCICGGFYGNSAGKSKIAEYQDLCEPTGAFEYYGFRIVKNAVPETKGKKTKKAKNEKVVKQKKSSQKNDSEPENDETIVSSDDFVLVEGGSFMMGDDSTAKPVHQVFVNSFYISKHELTQREYKKIFKKNPSKFKGENLPVERVSWYSAIEYCNILSEKENLTPCYTQTYDGYVCDWNANGYRLPTEAEWEYAARGGNKSNGYKYSGSIESDTVAWFGNDIDYETHEVMAKQPNELGLYDMSGNVWEWCWDWWNDYENVFMKTPQGAVSGTYRVLRGGSCAVSEWGVTFRKYNAPDQKGYYNDSEGFEDTNIGFRLVKNAEQDYLEKDKVLLASIEKEIQEIEKEIQEKERLEQQRIEKERLEKERLEKELQEKERLQKEKREVALKKELKKEQLEKGGDFVYVEGGYFDMGKNDPNSYYYGDTKKHKVYVSSFYICKHEVTQKEYKAIMGRIPIPTNRLDPSFHRDFIGDNKPVYEVTWTEAIQFCNKLSKERNLTPCYKKEGDEYFCDWNANGYRLPTEAEWEYAAQGGKKSKGYRYSGSDDRDRVAWCNENSNQELHDVMTKLPNELGIYDMSGNVYEWCWDKWDPEYYKKTPSKNPHGPSETIKRGDLGVLRGGNYYYELEHLAVKCRHHGEHWLGDHGIRLVSSSLIE